MANQLMMSLRLWPRFSHRCCFATASLSLHCLSSLSSTNKSNSSRLLFSLVSLSHRIVRFSSRGLNLRNSVLPSDFYQSEKWDSDSESDSGRSRNERKRKARRAVRLGMELATFSNSQIKRILRVASLDEDVFDAIMLVKRLGSDVREGKRRQFNYIGKLLRKAEMKLLGDLIQAMKDGDEGRLQVLSNSEMRFLVDDNREAEEYESEEDNGSGNHIDVATRWFDGLISRNISITNEVYSIHGIEFDRQELRKLVKNVHSSQEREQSCTQVENKGEVEAAVAGAKKSLSRFLHALAKQVHSE